MCGNSPQSVASCRNSTSVRTSWSDAPGGMVNCALTNCPRADLVRRRLLGEHHADLGAIRAGRAVRRVVKLELDGSAWREPKGGAGPKDLRIRAGRIRGDELFLPRQSLQRPRSDPWRRRRRDSTVFPVWSQDLCAARALNRRYVVDEHMVHESTVAGSDLDRLQPFRLGEISRDVEVFGTRSCPWREPRTPLASRTRCRVDRFASLLPMTVAPASPSDRPAARHPRPTGR